jgi:hypothetical protein
MQPQSPVRLMQLSFTGLTLSLAFGLSGAALLYLVSGRADAQQFLTLYIGPFNTLLSFGIIIGTALIVKLSQDVIPQTIESAFTYAELKATDYYDHKAKYYSTRRTVSFAALYIVLSFVIFTLCHFPLSGLAEALMMTAACAQWALASYVGRKLRFASTMLHSLLSIKVSRNIFKDRSLDAINTAVHIGSTLTVIFVYIHVRSYHSAPFLFDSFIGQSAKIFLLLPAVIGPPVLLMFVFYPREALRRIYDKSIDVEVRKLDELLKSEALSPFEKKLRLIELSRMYREELRYSLQLTLSDLPIGLTVIIMVIEPIINQ